MERVLLQKMIAWKQSPARKPLIIQGARQVGKTWLMKEFGKREFDSVCYVNFESNQRLREIFQADFDLTRILSILEIETKVKVRPNETLIILDEIQEAEKGLTALKYFQEIAPEYFVVAAGSLLGISTQKKHSFPIGKVDFLQLMPLSFEEFLASFGEDLLLEQLNRQNWPVLDTFYEKLVSYLRLYYFIGGMPEAVAHYHTYQNLTAVRDLQKKILMGYESDFAKHAPIEIVPRIRMVWNALLAQLAKENRKFIFGQVKPGARAKDFELAIHWLLDAGLLIRVNRITKGAIPLNAYADMDAFKLYLLDIGLLNAMANIDAKLLLEKNQILEEFKGAATEQFVCQQLQFYMPGQFYYWSADSATAEIDFVFQKENKVVPLEVKAEENLKAKSLKVFSEKYQIETALRASMSRFRVESWMINVPLFAIFTWLKSDAAHPPANITA